MASRTGQFETIPDQYREEAATLTSKLSARVGLFRSLVDVELGRLCIRRKSRSPGLGQILRLSASRSDWLRRWTALSISRTGGCALGIRCNRGHCVPL
jgi:hypothetical protein